MFFKQRKPSVVAIPEPEPTPIPDPQTDLNMLAIPEGDDEPKPRTFRVLLQVYENTELAVSTGVTLEAGDKTFAQMFPQIMDEVNTQWVKVAELAETI